MTSASNAQFGFTHGEWSKSAQGGMDDPRYRKAMNRCQNYLSLVEGSTTRRFGLRHSAPTRGGLLARVLPYVISVDQAYNIELSNGLMRFFQNGVLLTEEDRAVTNIALSTYVTVTSTAHGYTTGNLVRLSFGTAAAMLKFAKLTKRQFIIAVVDANSFTLSDVISGAVLTDSFTAFSAATDTVTVARVVEFVTPYTNNEWLTTRVLQSDDHTLLLQGSKQPQEISISAIDPANFVDGPYLDPVAGSLMTPDALSGIVNFTLSFQAYDAALAYSKGDYVTSVGVAYISLVSENQGHTPASSATYWQATTAAAVVNDGVGFGDLDAGRHIRLLSEPPLWATATSYTAGQIVTFDSQYWTALAGMAGATPAAGEVNPNQPGVKTTTWALTPALSRWTWGKVVLAAAIPGLIAPTGGTNFGNMTGGGGLAAAFDSNTSQPYTAACWAGWGTSNYVGKHWTAATAVGSVKVYPTSDAGLASSTNLVIRLYGKSGSAPASETDGTLLGTTPTFSGDDKLVKTIVSTDTTTTWDYVWINFRPTTHNDCYASEVQFYSASAPAGTGVAVQIIGDPLLYTTTPVRVWRLGVYNNYQPKWPTNGCYHEGRFWLAGAVANRVDSSMSNKEFIFSPTAPDGTVAANHGITYTFNFSEKNDILWMKSESVGILCGTANAAVLLRAPTPGPMSPTNIGANPVTSYGCANVEPVSCGLTTVFVNKYARQLHEQMRDAYSGAIVSPEISDQSKHLTVGGIAEITYTKALQPIVWMRTGLNRLIAATYRRTNLIAATPPEVNAWQQHPLGNDLAVKSISSAPSLSGDLDTLAAVVVGGDNVHHVVFGTRLPEEEDTIWQAEYLDDAIIPSCGESYTADTGIRLHGLWSLNNQVVTAFVAGLDCGDFTVTDGYIQVPYGSASGLFTKRYVTELSAAMEDLNDLGVLIDSGQFAIPAVIGFNFISQGQTLRPAAQDATGAQNGPGFGKTRRVNRVAVMVHGTQGLYLGSGFEKMRPALFKKPGGTGYTKTELFSGIYEDTLDDDNSLDGMLAFETRRPYPSRVLAIGAKLATQD